MITWKKEVIENGVTIFSKNRDAKKSTLKEMLLGYATARYSIHEKKMMKDKKDKEVTIMTQCFLMGLNKSYSYNVDRCFYMKNIYL